MHAFSGMAPLLYAILLTTTMIATSTAETCCATGSSCVVSIDGAPPVAADASFFGPHPQFFTTALPSPHKLTHDILQLKQHLLKRWWYVNTFHG